MKKIFISVILSFTLSLLTLPAYCTQQAQKDLISKTEQRLNLTEKQKNKTKLIYQNAIEQIKPLRIQIEEKNNLINTLKLSENSDKDEEAAVLQKEIKNLNKQINNIRKDASQDFEKILTGKQKKELKQMKLENMRQTNKKQPAKNQFFQH